MSRLVDYISRLHPVSKIIIAMAMLVYAIAIWMLNQENSLREFNEACVAKTMIFATKDIPVGSTISSECIKELINVPLYDKYLGCDYVTMKKSEVIGLKVKKKITAGSIVTNEDLGTQSSRTR